jgi:hypothetical protein
MKKFFDQLDQIFNLVKKNISNNNNVVLEECVILEEKKVSTNNRKIEGKKNFFI